MLMHGEAGVGKTRLLDVTVDQARRDGIEVLRGTCVHFTTSVVPYGALMLALRSWQAEGGQALSDDFAPLLAAADPNRQAVTSGSGSMLTALDEVLRAICSQRPLLLVVDDLQWADNASLDLLAYLIAGLGRQRLGLLLAYRDEDRRESRALEQWLGDTRRMPAVRLAPLDRLDQEATGQLVAEVLDRATTPDLARQVYARTRGNAYFTELLARHVGPDGSLPEHPPSDLADAVVARWKTLSVPARELTRLVALGGSPVDMDILREVVRRSTSWLGPASPLVGEGVAAGVLELSRAGRVWFRHPLLADLLLLAPTRIDPDAVHAAYAAAIEVLIAARARPGPGRRRGAAPPCRRQPRRGVPMGRARGGRGRAACRRGPSPTTRWSGPVHCGPTCRPRYRRTARGCWRCFAERLARPGAPERWTGGSPTSARPGCAWTNSPSRSSRARSSPSGPRRPGTPPRTGGNASCRRCSGRSP